MHMGDGIGQILSAGRVLAHDPVHRGQKFQAERSFKTLDQVLHARGTIQGLRILGVQQIHSPVDGPGHYLDTGVPASVTVAPDEVSLDPLQHVW